MCKLTQRQGGETSRCLEPILAVPMTLERKPQEIVLGTRQPTLWPPALYFGHFSQPRASAMARAHTTDSMIQKTFPTLDKRVSFGTFPPPDPNILII
jgi:hypothetical protein